MRDPAPLLAWGILLLACLLDWLVGDPRGWLHPVQVMGAAIAALRAAAEAVCGARPWALRLAGLLITLLVVGASVLAGWWIERSALAGLRLGPGLPGASSLGVFPLGALLLVGLASALAGRSLEQAVVAVLDALPDEGAARERLAGIVGRDVERLDQAGILRACAETASENAVDGLFAPLFWMGVGAMFWAGAGFWAGDGPGRLPGPLALAWGFKAASTLDSMLGYRRGSLRWLGTAGARLDDGLTWLPCRLVALGLPWAASPGAGGWHPGRKLALFRQALQQGAADPSPNAGVSQAAYALVAAVQLGGVNHYGGQERRKPLLAADCPPPGAADVRRFLALSRRLEMLWLLAAGPGLLAVAALAHSFS